MYKTRHRQQGAAALAIVMILLLIMLTMAAFASRNLLFEQKTAASQLRHAQAFEAAEAGLQWAMAMLQAGRVDASCRPARDSAASRFRDRYLSVDADTGRWTPAAGAGPACTMTAEGWACSCAPSAALAAGALPAFTLEFVGEPRPGLVKVVAQGCSNAGSPCVAGDAADAHASASALFALAPALRSTPSAALTARGDVDLAGAPTRFVNGDPASGGVTIDAGGRLLGDAQASFVTLPGARAAASVVTGDHALATARPDALFLMFFGLDKATFRRLPGVHRLSCAGECGGALATAYAAGSRSFWVEGDLRLDSAVQLGTPSEPVLVAASGNVQLAGAAQVHGVVYSGAPAWHNSGSGSAQVHGAAIAEGHFGNAGGATFVYDPQVLARLQTAAGTFIRVAGSWSDIR